MSLFEEMGQVRKEFRDTTGAGTLPQMPGMGQEAPQVTTPAAMAAMAPNAPKPLSATVKDTGNAGDTLAERHEFTAAGEGQSSAPKFMRIDVDDDVMAGFSREYNPAMATQICIADKTMLLEYMVATERRYNITMSFPAYGVDPIVFDEVLKEMRERSKDGTEDDDVLNSVPPVVAINVKNRDVSDGREQAEMYEKIEVDGVLYLSCISECLDKDYLHSVIAEATEAIYMHGSYVYTMVGPKPITIDGEAQGEFIETLKLNSYELSVLLSYMQKIRGVSAFHGVFNGRSAIKFER